jgi:hypothetical protein
MLAGRTGQLRQGIKEQMPGMLDDLDSLQLASHLSAKYEQAALSGAFLPEEAFEEDAAESSSLKPPLPEVRNPLSHDHLGSKTQCAVLFAPFCPRTVLWYLSPLNVLLVLASCCALHCHACERVVVQ